MLNDRFCIGFANFGSMGVALAAMGVFAPTRKRALVEIAPRALIAANMVSLMTASIAGRNQGNASSRGSSSCFQVYSTNHKRFQHRI